MATTTTSTDAALIAEYWNNVFLNELRANLVFNQFALTNAHGRNQGTMCHWLGLADLTAAAALSEGTDPSEYTLSAVDYTATVAQFGASVLLSDLLQETWVPGTYQTLIERLARNAALTIDTIVRNACFTAGGSAHFCGAAVARNSLATSGFDYSMSEIRQVVNKLETLNVPTYPDGFYAGILHQDVKYDLQADTANWQEILKNTESGMDTVRRGVGMVPGLGGFVGTMYGVKFLMSQLALKMSASGSASTDVYQSYVMGPEFFGVSELQNVQTIIKNPHPASDLDLYGSVGWKVAFAARQLSSSRMMRMEGGSSLGT